jgi:hypothetical protein
MGTLAEIMTLIGPALDALAKLQALFAQPGGPTDDQLIALRDSLKSKDAVIQAG